MDMPIRVYLDGDLVAAGTNKEVVVGLAKMVFPNKSMVGEIDTVYGRIVNGVKIITKRTAGFFINSPAGMGL